jgi:hypothetical protein
VRKLLGGVVLALVAAACGGVSADRPRADHLLITESPSPYRQVVAGPVRAVIPDSWRPHLAATPDDPRQGLVAAPRPQGWSGDRPPLEGYAAMWVDGTRVGVPSDYYYLAATGPALQMITDSTSCSPTVARVFVDHVPAFAAGEPGSPGDFVARGQGTCAVGRTSARWAYFVAAPGYGPMRQLGIPTSSLYVVVAMMPDSPRAPALLGRMLDHTRFGGASIGQLIDAVRPSATSVPA